MKNFWAQEKSRGVHAADGVRVPWRARWAAVSAAIAEIGKVMKGWGECKSSDSSKSAYRECRQLHFGGLRLRSYIRTANPGRMGRGRWIPTYTYSEDGKADTSWRAVCKDPKDENDRIRDFWCGIFVTWALKSGGVPVGDWITGSGIIEPYFDKRPPCSQSKLLPGDVGYMHDQQHHVMVIGIRGGTITTIEGNTAKIIEYPFQTRCAEKPVPVIYRKAENGGLIAKFKAFSTTEVQRRSKFDAVACLSNLKHIGP